MATPRPVWRKRLRGESVSANGPRFPSPAFPVGASAILILANLGHGNREDAAITLATLHGSPRTHVTCIDPTMAEVAEASYGTRWQRSSEIPAGLLNRLVLVEPTVSHTWAVPQ